MENLFDAAESCLSACEIKEKLQLTEQTAQAWRDGLLSLESKSAPKLIVEPGCPEKPILVSAGDVPKRRLGSPEGLAALIHAVTHIEFNAINLAWDAVYRFRDLPQKFYSDWVQIAIEEAYHFQLLRQRLNELNSDYGDLPAHNGLWDMAKRTAFDPLVRMALVPRVLEARGLDVTPGIIERAYDKQVMIEPLPCWKSSYAMKWDMSLSVRIGSSIYVNSVNWIRSNYSGN
ncbi:ferritin-like domain-containing protein [Nitrosomonas ureae]|uniref:Ferritin-like domain-containing protein n=1 Tax=Nitrosomonas ureae TaxID=44577 RepID=A0A1H9DZ12_9PROT|nr:ferritin-like domain-containing protein [Nitrosomonas ureae]SEQ18695.1 Protein of unknown function [Nitrosomonas ureae]